VATYDSTTEDSSIISTPCETAQKYWIGGAALVRQHPPVLWLLCPTT